VATWNLQRSVDAADGDTLGMEDNASLLAELQRTLADQARTLADRSERRELVNQGEEIREFVRYLREAADAMEPSAAALETLEFSEAIQPQQRALQLLQRAEALFADIRLTRQEQGEGGGGAQAGQDMAEMFDLEMDLERNQYEQPDRGGSQQQGAEQLDDIFEELAELARREELQAERARRQETTAREERWQRQQLERDLERLQRELEQLEQQAEAATGAESEALQEAASEAAEQLQRARDALAQENAADTELADAESGDTRDNPGSDGEQGDTQELAEGDAQDQIQEQVQAGDALQEALRGLNEARSRDLVAALEAAAASAELLLEEQRDTEFEMRQAVQRASEARRNGTWSPGLVRQTAGELAQRKSVLQTELEQVRTDVDQLVERFGEQAPRTGTALETAINRLDESRASDIIGIAADRLSDGSLSTKVSRAKGRVRASKARGPGNKGQRPVAPRATVSLEDEMGHSGRLSDRQLRCRLRTPRKL